MELLAYPAENLVKLLAGDVPNMYFVLDPGQKSLVRQFCQVKIGGEYHKQIERNLELVPAGQSKKIDPAVEWNNPAVEQIFRAKPLAAKIIHDEYTIGRLQLQRCSVESGDRVELQV